MKYLKELYESESAEGVIYRNTAIEWLTGFLEKGFADPYMDPKKRFISFSTKNDSGGADDFGDVRIEFDEKELYGQGAIEIEYDVDFFNEHKDICMYVTGFKNENDYYKQNNYKNKADFEKRGQDDYNTLPWDSMIEDYENEAEVVIKHLKYSDDLITRVTVPKSIKKEDLELIKKHGISVSYF